MEAGPTPGRVKLASISLPGALGRNPTRRTDRCDLRPKLRFGLESTFITGNFVKRLLTYLGKFGQTAEASM